LEAELLQAKSALTGRWLLEMRIQRIFSDFRRANIMKGNFNATEVCRKIDQLYQDKYVQKLPSTGISFEIIIFFQ
jgi:hypothetical protein